MRRFVGLVIPFFALTLPMPILALTLLPTCITTGNCYTCDFLVLFVNWSQTTLYGLSGMAVLMVVVAGFYFVISAGRAEMVQKGRQIIVGTVIGLAFAFLGYLIVNTVIAGLLGKGFNDVKLFGTDWNSFCTGGLTPGGSVKDCTAAGVGDGAACSTSSCSEEGVCVCSSGACVSKCDYAKAQLESAYKDQGLTINATCEEDVPSCTAKGGAFEGEGYCLNGLSCCMVETN